MPAADDVRARHVDAVLLIELDNSTGFPRLTHAVLQELHRLLGAEAATPAVRAVVIVGTEQCFAAGADLAEVAALEPLEALRFSFLGQSLMAKIERYPKPIVAAIRGYCLGGGFDLALACHVRVASTDAVFGHPAAGLGIITGWGGTQRLSRIIGTARAREILTTGRTITAREAYAWRLVSRVVEPEQVVAAATEFSRACAART